MIVIPLDIRQRILFSVGVLFLLLGSVSALLESYLLYLLFTPYCDRYVCFGAGISIIILLVSSLLFFLIGLSCLLSAQYVLTYTPSHTN